MFGFSVDITGSNFLPLFEGALFFGVDMLLAKCKAWLIDETTPNGLCLMKIQMDDLINLWRFGVENAIDFIPQLCTGYLARSFMCAMCCESFHCVPNDLLLSSIKHPDLTVESERHLADGIIAWLAANAEQFDSWGITNDDCHKYLEEIRISLLPLWFVAGKRRCRYFGKYAEKSISAVLNLVAHPPTQLVVDSGEAHHCKIRLSQYTKKVDLSRCPQMNQTVLFKSLLPSPYSAQYRYLQTLSFGAVEEVDISNCPNFLPFGSAGYCLSKSFPSVRVLRAAHYLSFKLINLRQLLKNCPLLTEVDLTVDISPLIPSEVSIVSSSPAIASRISTNTYPFGSPDLYKSGPSHLNLTKLTLEGRVDVTDYDLKNISSFCGSLSYLSLRGCISVTDTGISVLILICSKLQSLFVCGSSFGCNSILALTCSIPELECCATPEIVQDRTKAFILKELHMGGCKGVDTTSLSKLMSQTSLLKSLCLREMELVDEALYSFLGSSLDMLDVSDSKVSSAALAHIVSRNPNLKCLRANGCTNLYHLKSEAKWWNTCTLEEIALGWGFSSFSIEALKPVMLTVRTITVGLGARLGHNILELLPVMCPLLESVILHFQVISDRVIINMMESLRNLQVLALCHCLGEISPVSFRFSMPNLRKLQLIRVTPWMTNDDLVILTENCANLVELFLLGCRLLNTDSQQIISSGWPGLTSIHLEDCGEVTVSGISSLFDCKAVEDILLRHNGAGIQKNFILHATTVMPMLRKVSLDVCDSVEGDFDIPNFVNRRHLSIVKIARCKFQRCAFDLKRPCRTPVHKETLVMVWNSKNLDRVVVKERL